MVGAAFGVALAGAPAGALADSSTGGLAPVSVARITSVECHKACVASDEAMPGSVLRIRGRNLDGTGRVVFLGRAASAADDARARVRRRDAKPDYVDVKVPAGAHSGPVAVVDREGTTSQPSSVGMTIDRGIDLRSPGSVSGSGVNAKVESRVVYFAGKRQAKLAYVVTGPQPTLVRIDLVRVDDGTVAASWSPGAIAPGTPQTVTWSGGAAAGDSHYQFQVFTGDRAAPRATQAGGPLAAQATPNVADSFLYLQHIFPIRGRHDYGDAQNRYGAPRAGHTHAGQDVLAACGTPLVAVRGGKVLGAGSGGGAGNYVAIHGAGSDYDTFYAHLRDTPLVSEGQRVYTGQLIGFVGQTGDASVCHLHFELWQGPWWAGGHTIDPLPALKAWDKSS